VAKLSKLYTTKQITEIRNKLIQEHGNKCAICQKPREAFKKSLSVDHNHKTNKIRGLLCYRCNKFRVGRQTIETTKEVLEYLLKYDLPEGGK
jgi:hypothetical protein